MQFTVVFYQALVKVTIWKGSRTYVYAVHLALDHHDGILAPIQINHMVDPSIFYREL